MEIRRIDPNTFPNFQEYLFYFPSSFVDSHTEIYSILYKDSLYLIYKDQEKYYVVVNNNGVFSNYSVGVDNQGDIVLFQDELNKYTIDKNGNDVSVIRTHLDSYNIDRLIFDSSDSVNCLEYRQFNDTTFDAITYKYGVPEYRDNIASALLYSMYHLPVQMELHQYKGKFFIREKIYFYFTDFKDSTKYRRAYIVTKKGFHLASLLAYDAKMLIKLMCDDLHFSETIDEEMKSVADGSNVLLNETKHLILSCNDYIKGLN